MSGPVRCWSCGVEPDDSFNIMSFVDVEPVDVIHRWPTGGDHVHEERQPSPETLLDRGAQIVERALREWAR